MSGNLHKPYFEVVGDLLRDHGYDIVGPDLAPPRGFTTKAHFEAASEWPDPMEWLTWAVENGATVAEMEKFREIITEPATTRKSKPCDTPN